MSTPFPPGPSGGLLGLRLLARMQRDLAGHCADLAREHGDSVHYRVGNIRVFQFTHPDQAHEVLVARHRAFQKSARMRQVLAQWNGNGLVLNEGDAWVRQRRLVQPAFKPQRVEAHVAAVARRAGRMLDAWAGRPEVDVAEELGRLTLGVAAEALFGADVEHSTDAFLEAVAVLNEVAIREMTAPFVLPLWAPTPGKRRLRRAVGTIDAIVRRIIAERRRTREDRGDLLSALLLAVDEEGDGRGMTDEQARDESVNLLLGGPNHESPLNPVQDDPALRTLRAVAPVRRGVPARRRVATLFAVPRRAVLSTLRSIFGGSSRRRRSSASSPSTRMANAAAISACPSPGHWRLDSSLRRPGGGRLCFGLDLPAVSIDTLGLAYADEILGKCELEFHNITRGEGGRVTASRREYGRVADGHCPLYP